MALSYRARKNLALLILVVGIPLYIVVAVNLMAFVESRWGRPGIALEFAIYVGLGVLWAIPCRKVFRGIGQADPDAKKAEGQDPSA